MNSIAIWYERQQNLEDSIIPEIDVHINHWKLKFKKNYIVRKLRLLSSKTIGRIWHNCKFYDSDYFMDIGFKISNGSNVGNICFYVPYVFDITSNILEDIGNKLIDARLLTALLNEPYAISTTNNKKYFTVSEKDQAIFNIYKLDIDNDISVENIYNGSIIRFQFREHNNIPTYYRIRLKSSFVNKLSFVYTPSNAFLESAYSSIEIIDFRINNTRNLDVSLIEHMSNHGKFNIALVHYFVMRSVKDEYILSNQTLNAVRQLEEQTWSTYINQHEYKYEKSFAYHLKQKTTPAQKTQNLFINDFSAVLKFKFEDAKLWRYMFWFLIIALLIELFGNSLYDFVNSIVSPLTKEN